MWKRVVTPVIVVSALWGTVSIATAYLAQWTYNSQERMLRENLTTVQATSSMQDVLSQMQSALAEAAQRHDPDALSATIAALKAAFDGYRRMAETTCLTVEEQTQAAALRQDFFRYAARVDEWLRRREASESPPDDLTRLSQKVAESCKDLLDINKQLLAVGSEQTWRLTSMMTMIQFGFVISAPVIGILLGLWAARGIRRSISQISVTLSGAAGELEHEVGHVELVTTDDLPALQQQVEVVAGRIRQVMDQLQQARREMMRTERLAAVGELAAGVAHEIRNPLTSVKLLIQTAAQRSPNHALTDLQLEVVQEEIARIEKTVQGLLDFARPPRLRPLRHDLCDTLHRALSLLEGRAKQREVTIAEDVPGAPVMITGDPGQLQQVFVNLLLNSMEAMSGGGLLHVAVEQDEPARGPCGAADSPGAEEAGGSGHDGRAPAVCRVVIRDSGQGIPEAVLERLFEPFVTGREHGTGLGLAISRRIVRQHGGNLWGVNRPGGGAEFIIELPVDASPAASEPAAREGSPAKTLPHFGARVAPLLGG